MIGGILKTVAGIFSGGGSEKTGDGQKVSKNDQQVPSQFQMAYNKGFDDGKKQFHVG